MEKTQKYQDRMVRELCKIWQVKVNVVHVVVGVLGIKPKVLGKHLDELGTTVRVHLLRTAKLSVFLLTPHLNLTHFLHR